MNPKFQFQMTERLFLCLEFGSLVPRFAGLFVICPAKAGLQFGASAAKPIPPNRDCHFAHNLIHEGINCGSLLILSVFAFGIAPLPPQPLYQAREEEPDDDDDDPNGEKIWSADLSQKIRKIFYRFHRLGLRTSLPLLLLEIKPL